MKLKIIFFPLTLIISFAIFILMIKPEWESLGINKVQLDTFSEKRDTLLNGKQNLQKAFDEYEELDESDRQLIMNAVPPYNNNDDFIAEIYKNMQGSGAFLVSTALKEKNTNSALNRTECRDDKANIAQAGTSTEDTSLPYCPPERTITDSRVEIVGNYLNIKDFVKLIDNQNRLAIPTKTTIERIENNEEIEGEERPSGDLVKGILQFDFFNKDIDERIVLSNMAESNDKVLSSLLLGSVNTQAIDAFKDSITSDAFRPVSVSGMGKVDLFAK